MALTDDLISYWKMDEASGSALDAHGSNDLTDNNTVGAGTGIISGARDFELANTEYFSHADSSDFSPGNADFAFSAWVKPESFPTSMVVIGKWDNVSSSSSEYFLQWNAGTSKFTWFVRGTGLTTVAWGSTSTTAGVWYHLYCEHDSVGNTIGISVNNGTLVTAAHTTGAQDTSEEFKIGARVNTTPIQHWDGLIDEVGLWHRILSAAERTTLYNGGSGLAYPFTASSTNRRRRFLCGAVAA